MLPTRNKYSFLLVGVGVVALLASASPPVVILDADAMPKTVLWAWERPEHLDFIDPNVTGVAFLDRTLTLTRTDVRVRPRFQPLVVPKGTRTVAVVRIESTKDAELSESQRGQTVTNILAAARAGVRTIQMDFDALESERQFYGHVLGDVRIALPQAIGLEITALASWCLGDPWIRNLPIQGAVPMLFRMGADARNVERTLNSGGDFALAMCRQSVGISTDEEPPRLPAGRRRYVFNPRPWSTEAFDHLSKRLFR